MYVSKIMSDQAIENLIFRDLQAVLPFQTEEVLWQEIYQSRCSQETVPEKWLMLVSAGLYNQRSATTPTIS